MDLVHRLDPRTRFAFHESKVTIGLPETSTRVRKLGENPTSPSEMEYVALAFPLVAGIGCVSYELMTGKVGTSFRGYHANSSRGRPATAESETWSRTEGQPSLPISSDMVNMGQ